MANVRIALNSGLVYCHTIFLRSGAP